MAFDFLCTEQFLLHLSWSMIANILALRESRDQIFGADVAGLSCMQKAADAPATVKVVCNSMCAIFHTQRSAIETLGGQLVSPTEFERISGKGPAKKWKASIRIDKVHILKCISWRAISLTM